MAAADDSFDCDVLVVGGGPSGSTTATLLRRRGHRVIQLEKDRHPRFHIGESLLPCNLPIMEELGVLDKVRALGVL
jgi:flavin-dependent dehydrogenase